MLTQLQHNKQEAAEVKDGLECGITYEGKEKVEVGDTIVCFSEQEIKRKLQKMSHRIEKINDLVRDNVAEILVMHLSFKKGVFVSVSRVDTSKDLRYARVFVSIFPGDQEPYAMATLKKELYQIQGELNKKIQSKILPRIEFISDKTQQGVDQIEEIFQQIHNEDENSQGL